MNSSIKPQNNSNSDSRLRFGCRAVLIALVILATVKVGGAAVVHGTVYSWETLEPLPKTEIIVNTTPEQHMISEDGTYEINLSTGTYSLEAVYYRQGSVELYAQKNITIERGGDYKIDLILFPPLSDISPEEPEDLNFSVDEDNQTVGAGGDGTEGDSGETNVFDLLLPVILVILLVGGSSAYIVVRKKRFGPAEEDSSERKSESEPYTVKEPEDSKEPLEEPAEFEELPEDLQEALSIIRKEGGRITQKNLRKKMGYSEAKMSLVIADLERRNIVEKVKKGRGNIIFLKDSENL